SSTSDLILNDVIIPAQTPAKTPEDRPHIGNIHITKPRGSELKLDDFITNPNNAHLNDFFFIPPWEYLLGSVNAPDPYREAREAGFVVIQPEQRVPSGLG